MNDILAENKRLQAEIDKLLNDNMELTAVIRALRKNAREDAKSLEDALAEIERLKNRK
jgi:ribonuclease HI